MAKKVSNQLQLAAAETRRFAMHPDLLFDVIKRQAGTLHKALLEGIMNAVDAGATKIQIMLDRRSAQIEDDGAGITERAVLEKFWETFGQPPEKHERKTYGQFRMGRGQLFAFGKNIWMTGPFRMTVDVKETGLDYQLQEYAKPTDGCLIQIELYEPLLPSDLAQLDRELALSVKYVPAQIYLNGKLLTVDPTTVKWDHVTDDAYIRLRDNGTLTIFNLGVLVCHHGGHVYGCGGEVVSRKQLKVNFARNEVMSGCDVWQRIKRIVSQRAKRQVSKQPALTDDARQNLIGSLLAGELDVKQRNSLRLFTDVTGRHWALEKLRGHAWNRRCTVAPHGDQRGDRIMQQKLAFVFSQETLDRFSVETVPELLEAVTEVTPSAFYGFEAVEFQTLADAFSDLHTLLPASKLTPQEEVVLRTLRRGLWVLSNRSDQTERELRIGEADCADGWTDGCSYIAVNRAYIAKLGTAVGAWAAYGCLLVHEMCHDTADQGSHIHSPEFYRLYHDWTGAYLQRFVEACVRAFPDVAGHIDRRLSRHELRNEDRVTKVDEATAKLAARIGGGDEGAEGK